MGPRLALFRGPFFQRAQERRFFLGEKQVVRTGCKANVFLDILRRLPDGMHELESLFLPLEEPSDALHVEAAPPGSGLRLTCSSPELATQENILYKTYDRFGLATDFRPDLAVHLEKNVPWGSGLGGASADAAALISVLAALCREAGGRPPEGRNLEAMAAGIGADVPFFLHCRPSWVQGTGDILAPAGAEYPGMTVLVACPRFRISTAEAYRAWDAAGSESLTRPGLGFKSAFCRSGQVWWNAFEGVLAGTYPEIGCIKRLLLEHGAKAAVMSGSGSAMVALFDAPSSVDEARGRLQKDGNRVFVNAMQRWGVAKR